MDHPQRKLARKTLPVLVCIIMLILVLSSNSIYAQAQSKYTISGNIQDNSKLPVELATAVLRSLPDSALVEGVYSDSAGQFLFDKLKQGQYYLEVSTQGYVSFKSEALSVDSNNTSLVLPLITLSHTSKELAEVVVTTRKPLVEQKADRTVVNVDAMLSAAGSTALEALEKCPGVQVSPEGVVSLKGKKGVIVFINDKPSYLSGDDLANYLRSLPSSTLDQIELMTNPPAQYDAAGNAGIINIKIKRKGVKGFNGGVNLSVNRGRLTRSNNSVNINYRNNKVSTYLNAGYNRNNYLSDLNLNRTYLNQDLSPKSYFNQESYFRGHGNGIFINAVADYSYSDKTVVGITVSGMNSDDISVNDNTSRLFDNNNTLDSTIVARNQNDNSFRNGAINLNYRTKLNKGKHEFAADLDHIAYNSLRGQEFNNRGFSPDGVLRMQDLLTGNLPSNISIYAAKADYSLPIGEKWKLGAGGKASYAETDNKAEYLSTVGDVTSPDLEKSNQFIYKENINAAYLNLNREGRVLSIQAGLRMENTVSDGHQLGNAIKPDSAFIRRYTNLFPTAYMSYKLDTQDKHILSLNFGRRIDRPYYQDLNPFVNPMDKFTYYVGNPFLKPSLNNSISLGHVYKSKINTSVTYSKSVDEVNETIEISDGIYYSRPGNLGSKQIFNASIDADVDITKWLNMHVYAEYGNIQTRSNFYSGYLSTGGGYTYFSPTFRIKMNKGWDAELNGFYRSRIYDAQFIMSHMWQASVTVQKKINDACNIKLAFRDIFYSQVAVGEIGSLSQATANWTNRRDTRTVALAFSYRFGKAFENMASQKQSGAETEKNRIK